MKPAPGPEQIDDAILDAADRLLARDGYQQMTMEGLVQETGLAKRVIYLHYTSKADVILATIDRTASRVLAELQRIAASPAAPAEKLRRMIMLRVMNRFDSVQHYPETVSQVIQHLGPLLLQQRETHFAAEARVFAEVLKEAESALNFPPRECMAVAAAIVAATNALLPYSLSASELGDRPEVANKAERIATMLLLGLLRPAPPPKRRAA